MKRTLDNCRLVQKYGRPRQQDGKCAGFQKSEIDDEPCEICKECKLNEFYEED